MPVKTNVKSAVALARWMSMAPRSASAAIRTTPPTPTAPMKKPASTVTTARSAVMTNALPRSERHQLAREQYGEFLHDAEADSRIAFHEAHERRAVDRHDFARCEAVRGRDPLAMALDQRGPAEHVATPNDVARGGVAFGQAEREAHHAVGQHVEIVDRVTDRVDARVRPERARLTQGRDPRQLRLFQAAEEPGLLKDAARRDGDVGLQSALPAVLGWAAMSCLNFASSSSFMNTVCSLPGYARERTSSR